MQITSAMYQEIMTGEHTAKVKVNIAGVDYGQDAIVSMSTSGGLFAGDTMSIGGTVAREIDLTLWNVSGTITKMAKIIPYYCVTNGRQTSEWVQKGVFYIDTRSTDAGLLTIHGYDAMLMAEQVWNPDQSLEFPMPMNQAVNVIATIMGVSVDQRTAISSTYNIDYPANDYTLRDVLGFIAVANCGNFTMSDLGELLFVGLNTIPPETNYLVTQYGNPITFGGVRIIV